VDAKNKTFEIFEDAANIPSAEVLYDDVHQLKADVGLNNRDVYLEFSSREALRDFALSLLHESEFGAGEVEIFPLGFDGKQQVVNGVRLTESSSRIFIRYPVKRISY
jgi:hypothetical protein